MEWFVLELALPQTSANITTHCIELLSLGLEWILATDNLISHIPFQVCQYHMLYCALSFIGLRWNSFYFSIHLVDFAANFKLLRTVLRSVIHNSKQV